MKFSHFFIDHPRFAAVVSIFIVVFGLAAAAFLPVAQYPNIVPPTVQITASYPGASADVVARTIATPLEQAINGVENMDYISSQSTGNGQLTITVIFKIGTNINTALMLTHNRVQDTLSRLPQEVQLQGVQVKKTIPALLLGIHPYSPDGSRSAEYISNYFILHVRDEIGRLRRPLTTDRHKIALSQQRMQAFGAFDPGEAWWQRVTGCQVASGTIHAHSYTGAELTDRLADTTGTDDTHRLALQKHRSIGAMVEAMLSAVVVGAVKASRKVEEGGQDILRHRADIAVAARSGDDHVTSPQISA
jgi:AcrB/AcrD/AcrF family